MVDAFDNLVDSMLASSVGSCFYLNNRFNCKLNENFSEWCKDVNSSSEFSEAHADVFFDGRFHDGLVVAQRDMSLSHKYYVAMFAKDRESDKWQNMFTVVKIEL